MVEDQSEPGADSNKRASENLSEQPMTLGKDELENQKSDKIDRPMEEKAVEKTEEKDKEKAVEEKPAEVVDEPDQRDRKIEAVKETHEDDDLEGSQSSIKLVLEDAEENDEPKAEVKKENTKDFIIEVDKKKETTTDHTGKDAQKMKEDKVDPGSSKTDKNKEHENKKNEAIDGTKKLEKQLPSEKVTAEIKVKLKDSNAEDDPVKEAESEENPSKIEKDKTVKDEGEEMSMCKAETEVSERKDIIEPEVGVVGPSTSVSELLNEEELATKKPALPTDDTKVAISHRVMCWVEKSASKVDDLAARFQDEIEEVMDEEEEEEEVEGTKRRTSKRKRKQSNGTNGSGGSTTRKSQKVVSSIIRRSIRW